MRRFFTILACFIVAVGALTERAGAVTVEPTPSAEFGTTAPLLITAYQTTQSGKQLALLELYNQSDEPVDLTEWSVTAITAEGSTTLMLQTNYTGLLLPQEHVVAATVPGTSYTLQATVGATLTGIELHNNNAAKNYRVVTVTIKDINDALLFRMYTTTGYSTASQPFASTPIRPLYDDGLYSPPLGTPALKIIEIYPAAPDCAPTDTSELCGDYIKVRNTSGSLVQLDDYAVRTDYYGANRTNSNTISLHGSVAAGETVLVNSLNDGALLQLTNSGGYVWLEDTWGLAQYGETMQQYGQAPSGGYAYALSGDGSWQWTTTPTPRGDNVITAPMADSAACPEGKYRNPETGRCRTLEEAVNALTECEEGYERNAATNRCRKVVLATEASATPCKEGQERNPATNRCRSIASAVAELLPCDEGYERNPDTNRCRKVKTNDVPAAGFPVTPVEGAAADISGWYAFGALGILAIGYAVWEWRVEIKGLYNKLFGFHKHAK